jgi:CBS domain-containing protein
MTTFLKTRVAGDIMTGKVITIEKGTLVHDIYRLFLKNNIMGAPVIDNDGKVIGIVTERDLAVRAEEIDTPASVNLLGSIIYLKDISRFNDGLRKKLGQLAVDVMTSPVRTLPKRTPLNEIILFMDEHHINRVPIVDDADKLVGIVTRTDIIKEMVKEGKNL